MKSTHWLFADLVSLDDKRQRAKFVVKSGSQQAVEAIESFALRGDSVIVGGRTVGSVLEDGIALSKSRDIAFEVAVTSSSDWKLLSKAVVTGASLALHTRKDGGAWLDSITLRDAAPLNLGATEKFDQGDVLMKGSGFGERHTMTIGRGGSSAGGLSTTEFLDLLKGFRKTNESNRDHLMHAHGHLEKVGEHLTAAKARYPFDNNVRGAVASHESAMECLKEIDLPPGDADAPELEQGPGKPKPVALPRNVPTFPGPEGRWGGTTTGARSDPDVVTSDQPGRKMSRADANDAFAKAFTPEGRARSRRSVTFHR